MAVAEKPVAGNPTPAAGTAAPPALGPDGTPIPPKRSPGHRGADVKDTVAEMAAKAHEISLEAGSKMAAAMKDVVNGAAGNTGALVAIDSRNPTLVAGAPGESGCAFFLAAVLRDWGFDVDLLDQVPGRPNLVARLGPKDSPALMFAGHLDVVGVEGMTHPPFRAD